MRYKLAILGAAVLMLVLAAVATLREKIQEADRADTTRVHQHMVARQPEAGCDCDGSGFCTHLPLVVIDTKGQDIPGYPAVTRDAAGQEIRKRDIYDQSYYTMAWDGRDIIDVEVSVIDNKNRNNHPLDEPDFVTKSEMRVRGNSSRNFEKTPYLLNFLKEDGTNRDIKVMGMESHHQWALHGPYLDKSLVRNYLWYNLSGAVMEYAPNVRYCELILNGEYQGLYLMTETITNGGNTSRLRLRDTLKDTEITGYLLRLDRPTEADRGSLRDVYSYSERLLLTQVDVSLRYPSTYRLTPELAWDIELDFSAFEKSLYSLDYDTKDYGYENWIDVDSFVDYFLLNELSYNVDAGTYSTYLYKEVEGKYKLCVWDFNNACGNYMENEGSPDAGFHLHEKLWYNMLFRDEEFVEQILIRYEQLRGTLFDEDYLMRYIDDTLAYLGPAVARNNERWADSMKNWEPLVPVERNVHSHEEAVVQLKDWILGRIHWMDNNIHALKQYSHPSRNKLYNY